MYQTLVGIGMIVVGSAIIIFSERIAREAGLNVVSEELSLT